MKSYTKIYLKLLNYSETDFIPCELCKSRATEIHHINGRKGGGLNKIENCMAICRSCHEEYGQKKQWMYFLLNRHYEYLKSQGVEFSKEYFDKMFHKYNYDI